MTIAALKRSSWDKSFLRTAHPARRHPRLRRGSGTFSATVSCRRVDRRRNARRRGQHGSGEHCGQPDYPRPRVRQRALSHSRTQNRGGNSRFRAFGVDRATSAFVRRCGAIRVTAPKKRPVTSQAIAPLQPVRRPVSPTRTARHLQTYAPPAPGAPPDSLHRASLTPCETSAASPNKALPSCRPIPAAPMKLNV